MEAAKKAAEDETVREEKANLETQQAERDEKIRKHLRSGNLDQVISLLTDDGKRSVAKNSTLLTYYDKNGNPVILNIFHHPFLNSKDVSDRIYVMSSEIMIKYMAKFAMLLKEIGDKNNIRNFPLHIELRVTDDERIIPIEVNPMRFAGWCTTDVSKYAWGINVYECFMKQTSPDWNEILSKAILLRYSLCFNICVKVSK